MTRDQIMKVSKQAAQRVAKPKLGVPANPKLIARLAELKTERDTAVNSSAPVHHEQRKRA
ncbi:hypothetical protein RPMA_17995 [Tardiphaga alba]|uniref:Transcriptional regulator n=1 Tax=Tardiphaga alba TaxID=340268 RepID=A0ABX8AA44_9BRAD|nr:hypothetical protein [Tardiphaga alba]QUS40513.1 hypothetical protein RPMA_17995 [Tardiphaga alba]